MKKVILSLLVLLSVISVSERAVYYYGVNDTVILGKLVREKIKNPAGYNRNAVIYPYFIVFENPVDVKKTSDTERSSATQGCRRDRQCHSQGAAATG